LKWEIWCQPLGRSSFSCISLARHNVCNISIGGESEVAPVAV
jgi:hypothetical protein